MDDEEMALFVYCALKVLRKKRAKNRKWWVHPINSVRYSEGAFYCLYPRLRADSLKFFNYFRMSKATFDDLLYRIKFHISRQDTNMRCAIQPEEMLAMTLR